MEESAKKVIFSGMQPTGTPTLGNYLGAIKNWHNLQDEYFCYFCVADLHSITVRNDAALLRKRVKNLMALFIAAGLDPEKNIIYCQSQVPQHAELAWILNCYTYVGELGRMTQFKEKSKKHSENINSGLFTYPVLMAADILLYQTDVVPVGEDQRQHLEISRDIASRFNSIYGDVFRIPEGYINKTGSKIMNLQDPTKKMSKSDSEEGDANAVILLDDDPKVIVNKIKRAVTDSDDKIKYSVDKPGISNLLEIYSCVTGISINDAEIEFESKGYGDFKLAVGNAVAESLEPLQHEMKRILADKSFLDDVMKKNAEKATTQANKTLYKVKKKIGLPV